MRLLLVVLILLIGGLLAEGIFDSAIGAWVAFGALVAVLAVRAPSGLGLGPDVFDGD